MTDTPPVALTIAGSDSGGGAGIQADLRDLRGARRARRQRPHRAHGAEHRGRARACTFRRSSSCRRSSTPCSTTCRSPRSRPGCWPPRRWCEAVAAAAAAGRLPRLVVDPVLVSSTGARLLDPGAERAYAEALFPHALVVTPNTREAAALVGGAVDTAADAREAARELCRLGPGWVVVKGGHRSTARRRAGDDERGASADAVDIVVESATGEVTELRRPRVATRNDHGTGCTFAAATAALLARGVAGARRAGRGQAVRARGPGGLRRLAPRRRARPGRQAGRLAPGLATAGHPASRDMPCRAALSLSTRCVRAGRSASNARRWSCSGSISSGVVA